MNLVLWWSKDTDSTEINCVLRHLEILWVSDNNIENLKHTLKTYKLENIHPIRIRIKIVYGWYARLTVNPKCEAVRYFSFAEFTKRVLSGFVYNVYIKLISYSEFYVCYWWYSKISENCDFWKLCKKSIVWKKSNVWFFLRWLDQFVFACILIW